MKYIHTYKESIIFDEDDWDWEEEDPTEVVGNEKFTQFLQDKNIYDEYVKSVKRCNHDRKILNSIEDINNYIHQKLNFDEYTYGAIDKTIDYSCAYDTFGIKWSPYNRQWNEYRTH